MRGGRAVDDGPRRGAGGGMRRVGEAEGHRRVVEHYDGWRLRSVHASDGRNGHVGLQWQRERHCVVGSDIKVTKLGACVLVVDCATLRSLHVPW